MSPACVRSKLVVNMKLLSVCPPRLRHTEGATSTQGAPSPLSFLSHALTLNQTNNSNNSLKYLLSLSTNY